MSIAIPEDENRIPSIVLGIVVEEIEGEILVYHPATVTALYLNATGALVLGLCDGVRSQNEIVGLLAGGFLDAGAELAADVVATLGRLQVEGVIFFV